MGVLAGALKHLLRIPADALVASSTTLGARIEGRLAGFPGLAGKFYPYRGRETSYLVPPPAAAPAPSEGLPVPPRERWLCFEATADEYLGSGREHVDTMRGILAASGFAFPDGARVLDFGCGAGRMIRWLGAESDRCEIWGTDIQAEHVVWCQQHLSPPFHFVTTTTLPHLPFEDGYFDLVYAGGVFSQIADLADAWLLELRRVLAPGGKLYVTVHDRHSIETILGFPAGHRLHFLKERLLAFDAETGFSRNGFSMFTVARTPLGALVFYDLEHLRRSWGRLFGVRSVTPGAYLLQTAVLLEKAARVRGRRAWSPGGATATSAPSRTGSGTRPGWG